MSVVNSRGHKVELPRSNANQLWGLIREYYAESDGRTWRYLAMLALHEQAGWSLEHIGLAFGHHKGHVSRCLWQVKQEMRERFAPRAGCRETEDEAAPLSEGAIA